MNQPLNVNAGKTRTQIAGLEEVNRTIDDEKSKNARTKRNPGSKQFKEPSEGGDLSARGNQNQDLAKIRKNNFV